MKNYINYFIYAFLISILSNCGKQIGEIHSISLNSTSIIRVECSHLKVYSHLNHRILSSNDAEDLANAFTQLKISEKGFKVDARIFGSFEFESKKYSFCGGINIIEINNKKYIVDNQLRKLLLNLTKK